ncbi:MAG TPA: ABC transporter substrate-binding protein [Solirubrobacteraceae bacterium]|nr:ABC transporter substrate-binding protein [Solirubrobacteraceae bacterium]
MRKRRSAITAVIAGVLALGVAACGSSNSGSSSSASSSGGSSSSASASGAPNIPLKPGENPASESLTGGKKGGTLTVYSSEDFEHLDPGESYFSLDYSVMYATQRTLFIYPPNQTANVAPDLATAVPTVANGGITDGGKTITIHIQPNVKFSPPVNRTVTSKDVAYAIERGWNPNVGNAYMTYFAALKGASSAKGGAIPGITTPNNTTIVFHLTKPQAQVIIGALSLPVTAPVPQEFAGPMDKHSPTTYGSQAEVATGPYMIQSNPKTGVFAGTGYQTGKSLTLVRNPNWNPNSYTSAYKPPAYLNEIKVAIGGDASVIGPQVLKGSNSVQLDTPTNAVVKLAYQQYPSDITFTTGSGDHYVALDNAHGVFKNVNIRRAVWANLNRLAIQKERGGPLVDQPATHFIYPGNQGFQQAGGYPGPQVPWNKNLGGNLQVAEQYMKKAGYPSGKYTGNETVQIVGASNGNSPAIIQILNTDMQQLGLKTHVSEVDQSAMYSKYCGVPKQNIDACPTVGWIRDFANPMTTLYVTFYGPAIVPTNNSNWGQVNDPAINKAMVQALNEPDPTKSVQDWANIDKMLVDQAVAIPEDFDNQANIKSSDVVGVNDLWNEGSWDFAYTSLKNP